MSDYQGDASNAIGPRKRAPRSGKEWRIVREAKHTAKFAARMTKKDFRDATDSAAKIEERLKQFGKGHSAGGFHTAGHSSAYSRDAEGNATGQRVKRFGPFRIWREW